MAERAECVMLNKGPHILLAIQMLDGILRRMQAHQLKKTAMLRNLRMAEMASHDSEPVEASSPARGRKWALDTRRIPGD